MRLELLPQLYTVGERDAAGVPSLPGQMGLRLKLAVPFASQQLSCSGTAEFLAVGGTAQKPILMADFFY